MAQTPRALCVLSALERNDFFPGSRWNELQALLPNLTFLELPDATLDWPAFLRSHPCEILIAGWKTPTLPVDLRSWHPLQYVCYLPGSIRKLIPRALIEQGLQVTNWGDSISRTVAEATLLLTIAAHRRLAHWSVAMHTEGGWKNENSMTQSLFERRVGIHGFGSIAQTMIPLLKPFTTQIAAFSPRVPDDVLQSFGVSRATSLESLFSENEVIIELAPLTPQNHHLISEKILRLIPEGGVFVNVGRGAVVDEEALARVARDGKIQIALDVYEVEPLPKESPLRGLPNVILTPHMGGPTRDRRQDSGRLAMENLQRFLKGQSLPSAITVDIYDRST